MKVSRCLLALFAALTWTVANLHAQQPRGAGLKLEGEAVAANREVEATLVIFNTNDPDSADLARFYAGQRGIAKERVIGLACPNKEEITREEYDDTIAEPLRALFTKNGWWELRAADHPMGRVEKNRIRFIALMRGVPLKILPAPGYAGDKMIGQPIIASHSEAAVDSELATLGMFTRIISGARDNPYFRGFSPIVEAGRTDLMLVCRLDAATPAIVKRMITDSVATEREGLRGFAYIDARNIQDPGLKEGDKWLYAAAISARKRGLPVIFDNGEGLFPDAYPMREVALYFGWYTGNVAGPFIQPDFRFARGAVAVHIHSFSASTLRNPGAYWCAPLLSLGAAATYGNVYEPYLGLTPQIDIFNDRLQAGFTFAEAAWSAVRVCSWQTTFVGDPLYRPFKFTNDLEAKPGASEWDYYRDGVKLWFGKDRASGEEALRGAARRLRSAVIWEGLGLLELTKTDGQEEALKAFDEARRTYTSPEDSVRAAIHQVILLQAMKRQGDALALIKQTMTAFPKARAVEVIRMLDPSTRPPPPPPPPAAPPK